MKKSILIAGSILSLFILVSLSYQPIIAEQPIIKPKEEVISVESNDCGCSSKPIWNFPVICSLLLPIVLFSLLLWANFGWARFDLFFDALDNLIKKLDCWWEFSSDLMITLGE